MTGLKIKKRNGNENNTSFKNRKKISKRKLKFFSQSQFYERRLATSYFSKTEIG